MDRGSLYLKISVFGTTLSKQDHPFGCLHRTRDSKNFPLVDSSCCAREKILGSRLGGWRRRSHKWSCFGCFVIWMDGSWIFFMYGSKVEPQTRSSSCDIRQSTRTSKEFCSCGFLLLHKSENSLGILGALTAVYKIGRVWVFLPRLHWYWLNGRRGSRRKMVVVGASSNSTWNSAILSHPSKQLDSRELSSCGFLLLHKNENSLGV